MLAAAYLALNQRGDGSSPSSPTCTRDVTAACLLAMQDVRVQLPLGALLQDVGKPGNPPVSGTGKRGFKSHRPDFAVWPNGKAAPCFRPERATAASHGFTALNAT